MIRVIRRLFGSLMWKIYTTTWSPPNRPNQIFSFFSFFSRSSKERRPPRFFSLFDERPNLCFFSLFKRKTQQNKKFARTRQAPRPFSFPPAHSFPPLSDVDFGKARRKRERERECVCEREKKRRVHCLFVTKGQSIIGFLPFLFPTLQK